jgi:hypothetical protein
VAATPPVAGGDDRTERTLRAVSDIGQTMVSDADYEQVLAALIEKVCRLLDAESGGFMLYEPAAGELQLQRPAFGLDDDDDRIDVYRVPLAAGGNAVTVFLTGQPYFTNDAPNHPRCIQRYIGLFDVERFVTVRLQVQDQGRSDDMLKVSGIWVSPAEVESTINAHPAVLECAVVAVVDAQRLIHPEAFVVLQPGGHGDAQMVSELRDHVRSVLAHYKCPRAFNFVQELPKTATGKILRYRLRDSPPGSA